MENTDKLIELFKEFPGIGPRQAKRFVYFLLNKNPAYAETLGKLMQEVRSTVHSCQSCFRFFPNGSSKICPVCSDENRDNTLLMLVSHDVDFENIEKTHFYNGYYFILGGTVPILEKTPDKRIRQKDLLKIMEGRIKNGLSEIIIALNYNPEGENTLTYLKELLSPFKINPVRDREGTQRASVSNGIKLSTLGRGLSTGTELEYSDSETIRNALKNRQ